MQWVLIFVLAFAGFCLNGCSIIPKILPTSSLPNISAHVGKTSTRVAVQRDTNRIDRPIYVQNQIKDLTWRQNFIYCLLLIIAFSTPPIVPAIWKTTKKAFRKLTRK